MSNNQETVKENEYFSYVEKRIDKLEALILRKDDELKDLIFKTRGPGLDGLHQGEDEVLVKEKGRFDQVFKDIKEEEEQFLKVDQPRRHFETADLNRQLLNIEQREKLVQGMLNSLETALNILKQRHEEVNRKEESLNREYQRLQEMEALYQKIEKMETQSSFKQSPEMNDHLGTETKTPEKMSDKE